MNRTAWGKRHASNAGIGNDRTIVRD